MQPNVFLTILKILAFATLAFVVGVSSCQRGNVEDRLTGLDDNVKALRRQVEDVARELASGGGRPRGGGGAGPAIPAFPSREALDAALDPEKPLGTPGRYRDFLSKDAHREVAPEAAGFDQGTLGRWFGPEPKGFNFIIENDGHLTDDVELYVGDAPARRHFENPSLWQPAVCRRVEVSPDFREYTLFFREDVPWHAPMTDLGKHPHLAGRHAVTAHDFKFTLDIIRNPQTDCAALRGYYSDIEDVKVVDDHTAVVRWNKTLFHSISFTLGVTIMPEFVYAYGEDGRRFPQATIGQSFNDHWYNRVGTCGCGPYRFADYERGQRILLERFEDWYGARDGIHYPLKRVRLLLFPDPVTNLLKIKAGEVEEGRLNAPQWKSEILDNKDPKSPFVNGEILHFQEKTASYLYFGWKNTHVLFQDKRVRKALALACNREQLCRDIFLGRYRPMASPVYPDSLEGDPTLEPLPFDLKAAAALLDEAGWKVNPATGLREREVNGAIKRFEFVLLWPGPAQDFEAALNQYKNDLLAIGVRMQPQSIEWAAYQKKLQDREFEACSLLWATSGWEHDFDQIWHSRGIQDPGSSNHIEFSSPEVDRLSDELRVTMDLDKRAEMVRRIGRILYEEQPYCFFGWRSEFRVHRAYVKNARVQYKVRPVIRTFPMWIER